MLPPSPSSSSISLSLHTLPHNQRIIFITMAEQLVSTLQSPRALSTCSRHACVYSRRFSCATFRAQLVVAMAQPPSCPATHKLTSQTKGMCAPH